MDNSYYTLYKIWQNDAFITNAYKTFQNFWQRNRAFMDYPIEFGHHNGVFGK
jgi:hypothetical protein